MYLAVDVPMVARSAGVLGEVGWRPMTDSHIPWRQSAPSVMGASGLDPRLLNHWVPGV